MVNIRKQKGMADYLKTPCVGDICQYPSDKRDVLKVKNTFW